MTRTTFLLSFIFLFLSFHKLGKTHELIPLPSYVDLKEGESGFSLFSGMRVYTSPAKDKEMRDVGRYLESVLEPSTGYDFVLYRSDSPPLPIPPVQPYIWLVKGRSKELYDGLGEDDYLDQDKKEMIEKESYQLNITQNMVMIRGFEAEGVFRGVQTFRQLLPPTIYSKEEESGPFSTSGIGTIFDKPRFLFRSVMLDVVRHFFPVSSVMRLLDLVSVYKLNHFHIHLTDDQGWRIEIDNWPNLTAWGSGTEVEIEGRQQNGNCPQNEGGEPCFYTKLQYEKLVAYAASLYITIVPEIDMPGHTNAALASYADLNCDGIAPERRTDIEVGYSSLCVTQPIISPVMAFTNDVIDQISRITPGPYIHIGGDEAESTNEDDYLNFINIARSRVIENGKVMLGWQETAQISNFSDSVAQFWRSQTPSMEGGGKVIMSTCSNAYLDAQYAPNTPPGLGLSWCGYDSVMQSYMWDPVARFIKGFDTDPSLLGNDNDNGDQDDDGIGRAESIILGVEGCLWTETVLTIDDMDQMIWPRLQGLAETGWSLLPYGGDGGSSHKKQVVLGRSWQEYEPRLASHGPRMSYLGIDYFVSPDVNWE